MKRELVLLHGWGFQSTIWESFIPYLEKQFSITALNLSDFKNLDALTKNVLNNVPDSAVFIGWSLGGLVAMNIAIHYPERITSLITVASTPKFLADTDWPGMSPTVLAQFSRALKMDYHATLQQFILLQFHGSNTDHHMIKSLQQQLANNSPLPEQNLNEGLSILKDNDLREDLIRIHCPQLYLFGRCDSLVPPEVAEKIMTLTNQATIDVLPNVSHAPFLSNPGLCAEKIEAFLQ